MLRIRLSRTGKIRQPSYRVVVAEKESKRDGRIVELIGHYNPLPNPSVYQIKEDRALYWLSVGAQPTDAVRILLEKQGTLERLARLRAGESLDTLVAEFGGTAQATNRAPAGKKAAVAEAVSKTGDSTPVATETPAADATEEVEEAIDAMPALEEEE
ncbi:MAG TPA: 30S ribosomal protein S16 [Promineifilum sp.]